jgi:hypothetical protein
MQENSDNLAPLLFPADPSARMFPPEWRDVWFRRRSIEGPDGLSRYHCPACGKAFDHSDIDFLQGDHIWPYSLFGETSWGNYRLICGSCNASKSNFVEATIRKALGRGEFRLLIGRYLQQMLEDGALISDRPLEEFLGSFVAPQNII